MVVGGEEGLWKGKEHVKKPIAEFFRRPNLLCTAKYPDESSGCGMITLAHSKVS